MDQAVGIAQYKIAQSPERLMAYGLGSCVGVSLYDPKTKWGGLAHVMLPSSRLFSANPIPGKYADTAIEILLNEMASKGVDLKDLEAKLAGGANMFEAIVRQAVPIGLRNVASSREKLMEKGIRIVGEDVGGAKGRTMILSLENGRVEIRKMGLTSQWI